MSGKRIGVQYDTFGLTAKMYKQLEAVLDGFCELVDVSDLIRLLRVVKSPQELVYLRKAGEICDAVMEKGIALTVAGLMKVTSWLRCMERSGKWTAILLLTAGPWGPGARH